MSKLSYHGQANGSEHTLVFVEVRGTNGVPFLFGREPNRRPIEVASFFISTTPVTQALWLHVVGSNPAVRQDLRCPVENCTVSWRYGIDPTAHDGCIGFRIVIGAPYI